MKDQEKIPESVPVGQESQVSKCNCAKARQYFERSEMYKQLWELSQRALSQIDIDAIKSEDLDTLRNAIKGRRFEYLVQSQPCITHGFAKMFDAESDSLDK